MTWMLTATGRRFDLAEPNVGEVAPMDIAWGLAQINRFTGHALRPFIVPVTHQGDNRVHDSREPLRTVTSAMRDEHGRQVFMTHAQWLELYGTPTTKPAAPMQKDLFA